MNTPKIPEGWVKLQKGMNLRSGDMVFCNGRWELTDFTGGKIMWDQFYIRKAKAAKP